MKAQVITKPGCQKQCGDLLIPYPFGIKSEDLDCAINPSFELKCDDSFHPPLAFSLTSDLVQFQHVHDISDTEVRVSCVVAYMCYNQSGGFTEGYIVQNGLDGTPFTYSTANVLTTVGCDDYANVYNDPRSFIPNLVFSDRFMPKGCSTTCLPGEKIPKDECSGSGCCQVPISFQKYFNIHVGTYNNHRNVSSFNECGFAFIGEKSRFKFRGISDLNDTTFRDRIADIPIVLDWAIGDKNCSEAVRKWKVRVTFYMCS
ncbi:wall-associated receptor kinase 2-like [Heracleum sosnowskyi]|uniref:Wall-associated receptor kinase 2-like n=1 Tax=Heracleum sosnowskyi TaxID=360622 RepID=A0AAD8HJU4_9APIA|nr:wall-associated receptor kinase 2-like [Heracleum sosnowskyi]